MCPRSVLADALHGSLLADVLLRYILIDVLLGDILADADAEILNPKASSPPIDTYAYTQSHEPTHRYLYIDPKPRAHP